jgi:rubrerythrin
VVALIIVLICCCRLSDEHILGLNWIVHLKCEENMNQIFNATEVFAIGVQVEKNGKQFYEAARDRSVDPDLKILFAELADWEKNHVDLFEHLMEAIPGAEKQDIEYDPDNMIHLYLKSVADNQLFQKQDNAIDLCKNPLDILNKALEFERDAVILYSSMKEVVPDGLGKNEIDKLINEELKHVGFLTKEVLKLKSE